jgi:hypothetical protein
VANRSRSSSKSTAWLAVAAVLGLVWLPPEHVHEQDEHGEHREVVHRHLAPHHHADPGATFDHQDGEAQFLSSSFTIPEAPTPPVNLFVVSFLPLIQPCLERGWALESLHVRVHDPPWASSTGPRAPPPRSSVLI